MSMAFLRQLPQQQIFIVIMLAVIAFMACSQIFFYLKLCRLEQRQKDLLQGSKGGNLEKMLTEHRSTLNRLLMENQELRDKMAVLELISERNLRRVGLVRFDAFKETSGHMSYSLAILNDAGAGFTITGIFTEAQSRTYIKAVRSWGPAESVLTEEEERAIKLAYKDTGNITR